MPDAKGLAKSVVIAGHAIGALRAVQQIDVFDVRHQPIPPLLAAVLAGWLAGAVASPHVGAGLITILDVHVEGCAHLLRVREAGDSPRFGTGLSKDRKQDCRKNSDNCDY